MEELELNIHLLPFDSADQLLASSDKGAALIILDCDGWDATRLDVDIKLLKRQMNLPIVVISHTLDDALITSCLFAGAENFVHKGNPERFKAVCKDLLSRKHPLYDSKSILNALIREVTEVVWVKDLQGRYLLINEAGARVFGKEMDDIIGKSDEELFVYETYQKIRDTDLAVIQRGEASTVEDTLTTLEGKQRTYVATKSAYKDEDGNIQGVLGLIRDITERKKMEEDLRAAKNMAEAANRKKNNFLASMSHELRTPLHTIITGSNIALEGILGPLDDKVKEYFWLINGSGQHLLQIIDELLDVSKIEAGKFGLTVDIVPVNELAEQAAALVEALITQKKQSLQIIIDPASPRTLQGDFLRLKQALCNLLSNAHKFSSAGSTITLHCYPQEHQYCFSVTDTGIGIQEQDLERVLEPFEQVSQKNLEYIKGTGLGLPLAKKIAELHNGTLSVQSTPGRGSTFTISIPRNLPAEQHSPLSQEYELSL